VRTHFEQIYEKLGARTTEQLEQILPAATLELTPAEVDRLSAIGATTRGWASSQASATAATVVAAPRP
jgi:hypothetical protein